MLRSPVHIRPAAPDDVEDLLEVWSPRGAEGAVAPPVPGYALWSVAQITADPDQRLLVASIDGSVAGAAHLMWAPLSPIHSDTAIYVLHLQVVEDFRRHGVGRALMEAAVTWAEDKGTTHVVAVAPAASRDTNRFMARLGMGQFAIVRGASVSSLRAKLPLQPPAVARVGSRSHRNVGQVLVQRRSQRRSEVRDS